MTRARIGAWAVSPVRPLLPLCALLLALAPGRPARADRPPEDKDAEQRRALAGLGEKDKGPAPGEEAPEAEAGEPTALAPDRYVVQKGDTLWGICDTYFHDPWRWPKVWALNPDVTNPHWIFPGQTLHIGGITQVAPGEEVSAAAAPSEATVVATRLPPPRPQRTAGNGAMREVGFVDSQELAFAGTVTGSREEKIMLATGDQVYIEFSKNRVPKAGQRFSIYQVDLDHPVKEPQSRTVLGYLVRVFGDVTVDALNDGVIVTATLQDVTQPVERGYRVGPLFRQSKLMKPRPNTATGTARVVAAVQPNLLIAEGMLVVLNRGRRHGVEPGNRLRILRQGDGYRPVMETWETNDERFPPDSVAEVMAIDVRDETSIGWVLGGNRSIRIGDIADMKKGY